MTIDDLDAYVKVTTQLSEEEITVENSMSVLTDTLNLVNSFYPKLKNTMAFNFPPTIRYKVWDVTSDPIYNTPIPEGRPLEDNFGVDFPSKVVAIDWTLELITNERNTWLDKVVKDVYANYYILLAANKRRQANINDLPFDLRGQDFYQEAEEKLKELRLLLINSTPHLL